MIKPKQLRRDFSLLMMICLLACGCSNQDNELVLKKFSIKLDPSMLRNESHSDNGKTGWILLDGDTLFFSMDYDIENLAEKDPAVIFYPYNQDSIRNILDTSLVNSQNIVYTKKANADIDEFRKQNVSFTKISGYGAKVTFPRNSKNGGLTGVYFDSLGTGDGGRLKFNLYGKNLDSLKSEKLLTAFKSIVFHLN